MARPRHPHKEIEGAVQYAEAHEWRFIKGKGHGWGRLLCPFNSREGCQVSVWSTPRNPERHAKDILRAVDRCEHPGGDDEDV
jgi:hypothetical protein